EQLETRSLLSPTCVPPPDGIVDWWPGDGNTKDIVGGDNARLFGGAGFAQGEVGPAFLLDGATGLVRAPDAASLDITNQITIEAWINVRAFTPYPFGGNNA